MARRVFLGGWRLFACLGAAVLATAVGPVGDPDAFLIAFDHGDHVRPPRGDEIERRRPAEGTHLLGDDLGHRRLVEPAIGVVHAGAFDGHTRASRRWLAIFGATDAPKTG